MSGLVVAAENWGWGWGWGWEWWLLLEGEEDKASVGPSVLGPHSFLFITYLPAYPVLAPPSLPLLLFPPALAPFLPLCQKSHSPGPSPICTVLMSLTNPLMLAEGPKAEMALGGLLPGTLTVVRSKSISLPWVLWM